MIYWTAIITFLPLECFFFDQPILLTKVKQQFFHKIYSISEINYCILIYFTSPFTTHFFIRVFSIVVLRVYAKKDWKEGIRNLIIVNI